MANIKTSKTQVNMVFQKSNNLQLAFQTVTLNLND